MHYVVSEQLNESAKDELNYNMNKANEDINMCKVNFDEKGANPKLSSENMNATSGNTKDTRTLMILSIIALLIVFVPLFALPGAEFAGADGAGSDMVGEITGGAYVPWFSPVLETLIGGELPGEMESLFFCLQTGIGVGVIAFCFGYLVARKKFGRG